MDPVTKNFSGTAASVALARAFVGGFFSPGTDAYEDAVLLTSEAATNAVEHAGTDYFVTVVAHGASTLVLVEDQGEDFEAPEVRLPKPSSESGRGLSIIEEVSHNRWGVDIESGPGTLVWFEVTNAQADIAA